MIQHALNDLHLYRRLIAMQVRAQAQYRASLALDIATYFGVTALEFSVVLIVFGRFPTLLGWRLGEVALLYAFLSLTFGTGELVGAGIDNFAETIRRGEFDRVLLRPVGVLTQVVGSDFRLRRLGRLTQGAIAFALALRWLPDLRWTPAKLALLPLGIASGAAVFLAILLLGATLCFWTVETTELTNVLYYGGREMMSWPMSIYAPSLQRIFLFVVPVAFGTYVPVCVILGRALPFGMPAAWAFAAPLAAGLFALVAMAVWRLGIAHYQSTGS
ncbi:MAG TPA: ABC-2 family transporter protein [Ktedonobacterales bacterium]|jgi:ABC-2 type transport system permease protein